MKCGSFQIEALQGKVVIERHPLRPEHHFE